MKDGVGEQRDSLHHRIPVADVELVVRERVHLMVGRDRAHERSPEPARSPGDDSLIAPPRPRAAPSRPGLVRASKPGEVIAVPLDGARQPVVERHSRLPAEVRADDRTATRTGSRGRGGRRRTRSCDSGTPANAQIRRANSSVLQFVPAPDVVDAAGLAAIEHRERGVDPIGHEEELAPLPALAVDGDGESFEGADRERRHHALDLTWSERVGAAHDRDRGPVRQDVRAAEQIGRRFARRVRAGGLQARASSSKTLSSGRPGP